MARFDPIQTSFLSGEISPRLLGQVDLEGYKEGAKTVENFTVHPHGGISRRGGFRFVAEVKDSSKTTVVRGLAYKNEFFYMLEFGHNYIRFFREQAVVVGPTEVATTYYQTEVRDLRHEHGRFGRSDTQRTGRRGCSNSRTSRADSARDGTAGHRYVQALLLLLPNFCQEKRKRCCLCK